jgi:hypothetical protein
VPPLGTIAPLGAIGTLDALDPLPALDPRSSRPAISPLDARHALPAPASLARTLSGFAGAHCPLGLGGRPGGLELLDHGLIETSHGGRRTTRGLEIIQIRRHLARSVPLDLTRGLGQAAPRRQEDGAALVSVMGASQHPDVEARTEAINQRGEEALDEFDLHAVEPLADKVRPELEDWRRHEVGSGEHQCITDREQGACELADPRPFPEGSAPRLSKGGRQVIHGVLIVRVFVDRLDHSQVHGGMGGEELDEFTQELERRIDRTATGAVESQVDLDLSATSASLERDATSLFSHLVSDPNRGT